MNCNFFISLTGDVGEVRGVEGCGGVWRGVEGGGGGRDRQEYFTDLLSHSSSCDTFQTINNINIFGHRAIPESDTSADSV